MKSIKINDDEGLKKSMDDLEESIIGFKKEMKDLRNR